MPVNCLNIASFKELMPSTDEYIYSANIQASCKANKLQIECSVAIKRSIKLAVLMLTWYLKGRKLNSFGHSVTTTAEAVQKSFIKMRVNEKSNDVYHVPTKDTPLCHIVKPEYKLITTTSSVSNLPTLLRIELNEVKINSSRYLRNIWTVYHWHKRYLNTDNY